MFKKSKFFGISSLMKFFKKINNYTIKYKKHCADKPKKTQKPIKLYMCIKQKSILSVLLSKWH